MSLKMSILLAFASCAALGVAGCSQASDPLRTEEPEFVHDEGQPWCDELRAGIEPTDCALLLGDDHLLFFDYTQTPRGERLTVTLNTLEGQEIQSFGPIVIEGALAGPALRDLNSDGRDEILIARSTGDANTLFSVWNQDEEGYFHRAGELSGPAAGAIELRGGLIITTSQDNDVISYETASRLTVDGLDVVYELELNHAARHCELIDDAGLGAARLTAAAVIVACESRDWSH